MSVISSTWGFMKRHKGKLVLLGAGVGGYIYLNRLLSSVERNWEKSASKDFVAEVRKKETHFENSVSTANVTCSNLAPNILQVLDEVLVARDQEIMKGIKVSRSSSGKDDLEKWKDLIVVIFTRAVSEVYSICLFVCYLRVQLLVIAGYIYVDSVKSDLNGVSTPSTMNQAIQMKYLSLLNTFYIDGIKEIIKPVEVAVRGVIDEMNQELINRTNLKDQSSNKNHFKLVKEKFTCKDLENIFEKVKMRLSFTLGGGDVCRLLLSWKSVSEGCGSSNGVKLSGKEKRALETLMNETEDLLEQDDFVRTLNQCIQVAFGYLNDQMVTCFTSTVSPSADIMNGSISGPSSLSSDISNNGTSTSQDANVSSGPDANVPSGPDVNVPSGPLVNGNLEPSMSTSGLSFTNPNTVQVPLVHLIPRMRQVLYMRDESHNNSLVRQLLCLDILNCYSANVYEAFCDTNKNRKS